MSDCNQNDELIMVPGGPHKRGHVHAVQPGEAIHFAGAGPSTIVPDAGALAVGMERNRNMPETRVLTPGGFRHPSLVHKVERGNALRATQGHARLVNLDTNATIEVSRVAVKLEELPALGSGWVAYTYWNNGTGVSLGSFRTTWQVPSAPKTAGDQTIFLLNGIQNYGENYGILQPVLQWGVSASGGGPHWSVASWYVSANGHAYHSELVNVDVGQNLVGVMTLVRKDGNSFDYVCEFEGIDETRLPVQNIAELLWCNLTLEAYKIADCTNYPATDRTVFQRIAMTTSSGVPPLVWTPVNAVVDCGQHAVVVDNSPSAGQVEIWYH